MFTLVTIVPYKGVRVKHRNKVFFIIQYNVSARRYTSLRDSQTFASLKADFRDVTGHSVLRDR